MPSTVENQSERRSLLAEVARASAAFGAGAPAYGALPPGIIVPGRNVDTAADKSASDRSTGLVTRRRRPESEGSDGRDTVRQEPVTGPAGPQPAVAIAPIRERDCGRKPDQMLLGHAVQNYLNYMNGMEPARHFADFLSDVERSLDESFAGHGAGTLMGAARHLCMAGGKRARPLLVKIFGTICGAPPERLVDIGVASELIHSASLLHDDVVDHGMFRRGKPTVNARWGNVVAVMTGDMLLATALRRLGGLDARITRSAVDTVAQMTEAAIAEVEARGDLSLSLEALKAIAEGKTGALFGWCGLAAALAAGDDEAASRFDRFGRRAGVAFQMADDVKDVTGGDEGKPRYADIQSKNPSLVILLAAARDGSLRKRLLDAWAYPAMTPERVREIGTAILCSGAVELAVEHMEREIEAAIGELGPYASSAYGERLVGWARQLAEGLSGRGTA